MTRLQRPKVVAPASPLDSYFREINTTALLTGPQERELASRIKEGDAQARDQMARANLRLVVNIARGYLGKGLSLEDIIEEGNLGLMRAVEAFDPTMNTRFSTYASFWIKQSITRALASSGKTIRIPKYMAGLVTQWRRAAAHLQNERGSAPSPEEVAKFLGLSKKKLSILQKVIRVHNSGPQSDHQESYVPVDETFIDNQTKEPGAGMMARDELRHLLAQIDQLEPREADILRLRFGLTGQEPKTFKEIGDQLGLTRERVRQLESTALNTLRERIQEG